MNRSSLRRWQSSPIALACAAALVACATGCQSDLDQAPSSDSTETDATVGGAGAKSSRSAPQSSGGGTFGNSRTSSTRSGSSSEPASGGTSSRGGSTDDQGGQSPIGGSAANGGSAAGGSSSLPGNGTAATSGGKSAATGGTSANAGGQPSTGGTRTQSSSSGTSSNTGGNATGGTSSKPSNTGGSATGGTNTKTSSTGGSATGGTSTKPSNTGGHATGGTTTRTSSTTSLGGSGGTSSSTSSSPGTTPANVIAAYVDATNEVRAAVTKPSNYVGTWEPLAAVTWSETVAASARAWVEHLAATSCSLEHEDQPAYGENLAMGGSSNSSYVMAPEDAVAGWADEKDNWTYSSKFVACNGCSSAQEYGHYTQLVWRKSVVIGCGSAQCRSGNLYWTIIGCRYSPRGNYIGEPVY